MCFCDPLINAPYCEKCQHIYEAIKLSDLPDKDFNELIHMIQPQKEKKERNNKNIPLRIILGISICTIFLLFFLFI